MKCKHNPEDTCGMRNIGKCTNRCSEMQFEESDILEHSMMSTGPDNMITIKVDRISHLDVVYPRTEVHYRWKIGKWGIGGSVSMLVDEFLRLMNNEGTVVNDS